MQIATKTIERSLLKKGFIKEDSHHIYFHHEVNGKRTGVSTYLSHGSKLKDYNVSLLNMVKKQLRLDNLKQTERFCKCPMKADEYNAILKEKGIF